MILNFLVLITGGNFFQRGLELSLRKNKNLYLKRGMAQTRLLFVFFSFIIANALSQSPQGYGLWLGYSKIDEPQLKIEYQNLLDELCYT